MPCLLYALTQLITLLLLGIKYVVDAGLVKTRFITPQTGTEMLKVRSLEQLLSRFSLVCCPTVLILRSVSSGSPGVKVPSRPTQGTSRSRVRG